MKVKGNFEREKLIYKLLLNSFFKEVIKKLNETKCRKPVLNVKIRKKRRKQSEREHTIERERKVRKRM